ncbi:PREDICTED: mitochondrial import receptor subunit TOM22 homolog [Ceratosolen solmsi marchali]|uniref:Mitochondrial import receptor subunit TOM22 homolog n=1 Tax=Ceratosolen solmsi marchali TaxID=326594 RepID=A0AAJ6VLC5_9HYME|nr:PREDICTED: mitochondrial import receptor subunit TOM22 homolog [Ceratosolen solmsi marchali]
MAIIADPDFDINLCNNEMLSEVKSLLSDEDDDDEENEEDENLVERLVGLTEMFPEKVRNFGFQTGVHIKDYIKAFYSLSRSVTWLLISSSAILFAPIIFESERARMEEAQRNHQKQVLLGPSSAISSSGSGFPMAPPIQR